ncbi:MAG TPA: hypothetical protein VM325_18570 [Alphaproteobacteria bacterium]|nr:hypothetical protein [Alphaproteobacteria bacterium]
MAALLRWLDRKTYLMCLLFVFWTVFWGMNGLDNHSHGDWLVKERVSLLRA